MTSDDFFHPDDADIERRDTLFPKGDRILAATTRRNSDVHACGTFAKTLSRYPCASLSPFPSPPRICSRELALHSRGSRANEISFFLFCRLRAPHYSAI